MRKSYRRIHSALAGIVRFLFRIKVVGLQNEPEKTDKGILLCSNHMSLLDPISINAVLRRTEPFYMAKKSLFKVPVVKTLLKFFNAYPVNRGAGDLSAIHNSVNLLKAGNCVGIFAQGTRCRGVKLEDTKFKTGAALVCSRAEAHILPVRVVMKNDRWIPFRKITVIIGKLVPFESLAYESKKSGELDRITDIIFKEISALGAETE